MLKISTPFDELLRKYVDQGGQYVSKKAEKLIDRLSGLPKETLNGLLGRFQQKQDDFVQQIEAEYQKIVNLCWEAIKGSHIKIEVESRQINSVQLFTRPILITGKVIFTPPRAFRSVEVDCYLSCAHWAKLGDLKDGKINILDHLDKLLPRPRGGLGPIGLVTFQNGIMNNFGRDFKQMSQTIIDQFPEGPLCIGLHNATTHNLLRDMSRFPSETTKNVNSVYSLCQMMKTFADLLPKLSPDMVWTHFAHSEGGLIANAVLTLCNNHAWLSGVQKYLKEHLVVATYGAVKPVPLEPVLDAVNTYSKKDVALFFGHLYVDKALDKITENPYTSTKKHRGYTYKVTIIDSLLAVDPMIKIQMPTTLTLEQRVNMSWLKWLAYLQDVEDGPRMGDAINTTIVNTVNGTAHAVQDHGFGEVTYQEVLEENIKNFRNKYKVYDATRWP